MANEHYSVVIGDVNGRLSEVFGKLSALHAKNSFAFAIVAGNLFADQDLVSDAESEELSKLLNGKIEVPLPTYFSLGTRTLPPSVIERLDSNDGELCPNLTILGRKVSIKTSEGFRIVAVGGVHDVTVVDDPMNAYKPTYSDGDIEALGKDLTDVDLLITSEWPASITDGSKAIYKYEPPRGDGAISSLCAKLKPRYHFSTSEGYYEREPFFHNGLSPRPVTRFLSLAPFANTAKAKWIYAFSLEPSAPPPSALPEGCTAPPFASQRKRKLDTQQDSYNNFRYSNNNGAGRYDGDRYRPKRPRNQPPPTPDSCFFCLSSEAFASHMVASIGDDSYVTIAKGPLSTRSTFPGLDFPGHMLIIPLQHSPMISAMPDENRRATEIEMQRYRTALHNLLISKSKGADGRSKLGAVTWEISRSGGIHVHWQLLPVPVDMVQRGLVEAAFDVEAENLSYPKFVKGAREMAEAEEGDYLKVMIWSEALRKDIVLPLDRSFRFDLQFVRKVLAKLLGLENRMDWRASAQQRVEEEADVTAFKEAFKEFDFSLES